MKPSLVLVLMMTGMVMVCAYHTQLERVSLTEPIGSGRNLEMTLRARRAHPDDEMFGSSDGDGDSVNENGVHGDSIK